MNDRRQARIRTTHDYPEWVAAAIAPDNTEEMTTRVEGSTVVTTVERPTTGGLATTTDDYVSNLAVAQRVIADTDDTNTNHE
ncbi:KEOPS complex subunit Pcc1 [Halosegnis sp.]|uniref:KEOPS complex subunit Pcc1 n=1 Tax=Halosegnis sp. TaxID=2864959 RepID=UPI0035D3F8D5